MNTKKVPAWGQVDRAMRAVKDQGQENTLLPETFAGLIERLVVLYTAIQPLLAMLAIVPFLPPSWRKVVGRFRELLDAIVASAKKDPDGVAASFKAGRDL